MQAACRRRMYSRTDATAARAVRRTAMAFGPASKEILYGPPGTVAEHRLKVQRAEQEQAALRASELAAQMAPTNDAEKRIRIWEQLHALRLPRASGHVLVKVIATQTRLTVDEVHEEQRRRSQATRPKEPVALPV